MRCARWRATAAAASGQKALLAALASASPSGTGALISKTKPVVPPKVISTGPEVSVGSVASALDGECAIGVADAPGTVATSATISSTPIVRSRSTNASN